MRVLICPTAFGSELTARQAAETIAAAWRATAPHDDLDLAPLSDGGAGYLEVIQAARGGVLMGTVVSDLYGVQTPATVLFCDEDDGTRTAYVEAAQVVGPHLTTAGGQARAVASAVGDRGPEVASSYGVGQFLHIALTEGAARIVVAVGAAGSLDAGAGLLAALGAGPEEDLARGGLHLERAGASAVEMLAIARERFAGVDLVLATEDTGPLLGFAGAAAQTVHSGFDAARAQRLEAAIGHFTDLVGGALPTSVDLFTGLPRRLDRESGAGAGGGIGYALLTLGARRTGAVQTVLDSSEVERRIAASDLVVTGEGCFDHASLRESVPAAVSAAAASHAVPVVLIAGQSVVGRREAMALGLSGVYPVVPVRSTRGSQAWPGADPVGGLRERACRVAATWSPPPGR